MTSSRIDEWKQRLRLEPLTLDGGMATALEARGHDLSGELWSARLLVDAPAEIVAVHREYVAAGAEVITTASYQTSRSGFERAGMTAADADAALLRSIELAQQAAGGRAAVAASVGPYGATLADGSEYRGDYRIGEAELTEFHRERLSVLCAAEPDLLAFETIPAGLELDVINRLLTEEFTDIPAWVSVSAPDSEHISDGEPIRAALSRVTAEAIIAVGINCTRPEHISGLLTNADQTRPLVVYPNAGRTWDAQTRSWSDAGADRLPSSVLQDWLDQGVRLLGGCCGLGFEHVADVSELLRTHK